MTKLYELLQTRQSNIEIVDSFEGVNSLGIRAINNILGEALLQGRIEITPSELEEELCEPDKQD